MHNSYRPNVIEEVIQQEWETRGIFTVQENARHADGSKKAKYYACSMLPYPSGKLHMGHVRNYTINDVISRQLRMRGYNVLMPMGWDAFGMPAENAAIQSKQPPAKWTFKNIAYMKRQMRSMGLAIDWSREICACNAGYYKWNQWFFLKMLEKNIAYRKTQIVNWDPVDQTVLANEQVIEGRGWRSGALVERREIPGYYLRITNYSQELLNYVRSDSCNWPKRVRLMQENWIGKSEGIRLAFLHKIRDQNGNLIQDGKLYVFTTRLDTIMGATFCVIAPEHNLAIHAAKKDRQLADFIKNNRLSSLKVGKDCNSFEEAKGISTGLTVEHPLTGEAIELWVSTYALIDYGDGALMGVPAHDLRDFVFAHKYGLQIRQVVAVNNQNYSKGTWQTWYSTRKSGRLINSGKYNGLSCEEAVRTIINDLKIKGLGEEKTNWRLRDWGISRQRYWGTPIPIIHCQECGPVPVPEKDLPVLLPQSLIPDGKKNPLEEDKEFLACLCPKCGQKSRRETDTMDTFIDSSWYFLRYTSPDNGKKMVDWRSSYWMPIDQYIGGIEHAILHLLYARFWTKVMRDLDLVNIDEPFKRVLCQGMVLNHVYWLTGANHNKEYLRPEEVENTYDEKGKIISTRLKSDGRKANYGGMVTMSKSKNNGIDPQLLINKYGADTVRFFIMFASAPEQNLEWSGLGIEGSYRFLRRLWNYSYLRYTASLHSSIKKKSLPEETSPEVKKLRREIYTLLRQANQDYEKAKYNTVISAAMKMLNILEAAQIPEGIEKDVAFTEATSILVRILHPIVPHITWQIWHDLGYPALFGDLISDSWPKIDNTALENEKIEIVVQIDGKFRGKLLLKTCATRQEIEDLVTRHNVVARYLDGNCPERIVIVPGKLVNVVTKQ